MDSFFCYLTMFSGGFDVHVWADVSLDFAVFLFKEFDIFPNQYQNMTVDTATFKIRNITDSFQHFLFNSDGHTFHSHTNHSVDILCAYFIFSLQHFVESGYMIYLQ